MELDEFPDLVAAPAPVRARRTQVVSSADVVASVQGYKTLMWIGSRPADWTGQRSACDKVDNDFLTGVCNDLVQDMGWPSFPNFTMVKDKVLGLGVFSFDHLAGGELAVRGPEERAMLDVFLK